MNDNTELGYKNPRGRPKKIGYAGLDALERIRHRLPNLIEVIYNRALKGDKDCAVYLVDRVLGRPHQSIDQRVLIKPVLTADDLALAVRIIEAQLTGVALLKEGVKPSQESQEIIEGEKVVS